MLAMVYGKMVIANLSRNPLNFYCYHPYNPIISWEKESSQHFEFSHPFEEFGSGSDVMN